jgi:peptide/nickel transport system substrate-binding protein
LLPPCRRASCARLLAAVAVAVGALGLAAGCGGDGAGTAASGGIEGAGSGGTLAWAVAERPRQLDPLVARSRAEQLVARQIYEPLVEQLSGPFGDVRIQPGLASPHAASGDTIWRLRLRGGVRFQDGRRFDAGAVLANVRRWRASPQGRALLPDLVAADAPRPDLVRFVLDRPDQDFSADLSSPRLGVVSPAALGAASHGRLARSERAGTGPFELRERTSTHALVARNVDWWGTPRGLGPALDQVDFRVASSAGERLRMLRMGDVEAADELGPTQLDRLRRDPLLTALPGPNGTGLGLQRSVRGIESARDIPILSGAWLTTIGAG